MSDTIDLDRADQERILQIALAMLPDFVKNAQETSPDAGSGRVLAAAITASTRAYLGAVAALRHGTTDGKGMFLQAQPDGKWRVAFKKVEDE